MTEHTALQLRRGLRAALAATAVASIAFAGVACTQTGSGQDDPNTQTSSSDAAGADASSADTKGTDTKGTDTTGSDAGSSGGSSGRPTEKSKTTSPGGKKVLDEELGGQEAIDALGDDIDYVAKLAGKSVDELKDLLLRDKSAHVTTKGRIVYRD